MIKNLLLIGLGGGLGSIGRYLCQKWFAENLSHPFPWGTFIVNLSGCFILGLIYALAERTTVFSPQTRLLLITGLCGGFTTFSAFAFESMSFAKSGDNLYLLLYSIGSVVLGIVAVFAGIAIIKQL